MGKWAPKKKAGLPRFGGRKYLRAFRIRNLFTGKIGPVENQGFQARIPPSNRDNYLLVFRRVMAHIGKAKFSQA
jgi:hypothetical protein